MRPNLTNLSSAQRILSPRHQTFERRRGRHFNVPTQRVYHRLCDRDDWEQLPGRGESSIKGFGVRVWRELGAQVIIERLRSLYNFIPYYITNVNAHSHHSQHTIMDLVRRLVCVLRIYVLEGWVCVGSGVWITRSGYLTMINLECKSTRHGDYLPLILARRSGSHI